MFDLLKEYAYKRADLLKMEIQEKTVTLIGMFTFLILAFLSALFFIILFLFGLGFLIGSYLNNYGYGLLIVAGFYLLVLIVLYIKRNSIKNRVANKILESLDD
ncbi:phage holin family protein [Halpernia sp.]|uniref:phage holin family protein n=1 Tax=Halpernia sp. TaxID=2782209 RepID=UPI003A912CEC